MNSSIRKIKFYVRRGCITRILEVYAVFIVHGTSLKWLCKYFCTCFLQPVCLMQGLAFTGNWNYLYLSLSFLLPFQLYCSFLYSLDQCWLYASSSCFHIFFFWQNDLFRSLKVFCKVEFCVLSGLTSFHKLPIFLWKILFVCLFV